MINLKRPSQKKFKSHIKSHSCIIWCIIALFFTLSFTFKGICDSRTTKSTITLPTSQDGIEKIEYMVNGVAKGSTDGVGKIEVENGSVLAFGIKFQDKGYDQLHIRNIKIQSENGSVLRLNRFAEDNDGNLILMRVNDDELIDTNQTYISSDYIVRSDDKFNINGISENTYSTIIKDEYNDVNLFNAVELKYSENGGSYVDAQFSEEENAFIINNIKNSSNVKLMINVKEGYTDEELSLVCGESQLAISSKSKICSLPEINDNLNLSIRGLQKKSYTLTFNEYTNAKFSHKIDNSDNLSETSLTQTHVYYGDTFEFTCISEDESLFENNEVTANGIVIAPENGVYKIKDIKSDYNIEITPKNSALYPISLQTTEDRIKLCDLSGNEVSSVNVNQNGSADFKIIPSEAYSKYFITTQIYAVPVSKTSNGTYDITSNHEETSSFLIIPNSESIYSLQNVTEPIILIPSNLQATTYTVNMPDKIIGAKATVETSENIQQISDTKFIVTHGADFRVNIEAEPGYDISNMTIGDMDNSTHVIKNGNSYTYKNIDGDKYLIINGASQAYCNVKFDSKNLTATDIFDTVWKDNSSVIKYQDGTIQFKIKLGETQTHSDIGLSIKSGNGKLEKISSESNIYSLSNVTQDTVIGIGNENSQNVTITLNSNDENIQFTDIHDESIILPKENTLKLGQDFDFKVVSKNGESVDNLKINSSGSNLINENQNISNAYTLAAMSSDVISTEKLTKNSVSSQSTVDRLNERRALSSELHTPMLTSSSGGTRGAGVTPEMQTEWATYSNKATGRNTSGSASVGLTLADKYIFPQATDNTSTNDILPEVSLAKNPKYVLFSTDAQAKDCVNTNLITFENDGDLTFDISANRNKDKFKLPPLCYRYRDNRSYEYEGNPYYLWGWWSSNWCIDAYSPGDDYYDPANSTTPYPGGTFSLLLHKAGNKLSFNQYKISSTRNTYGTTQRQQTPLWQWQQGTPLPSGENWSYVPQEYNRNFTLTSRRNEANENDPKRNNYVTAIVPKVFLDVVYPQDGDSFEKSLYNSQHIYYDHNFDEPLGKQSDAYDQLWRFTNTNRQKYETPYKLHDSTKNFTYLDDYNHLNSNIKIQGPRARFDYTWVYKPYFTLDGVSSGLINEVTFDSDEAKKSRNLLCRLDTVYCHTFDQLYDKVEINKNNLGDGVTIDGNDVSTYNGKKVVSFSNSESTERERKSFNVYLPNGYVIKSSGNTYEPLELDGNMYNEIASQEIKYDRVNKRSYVEVTANMSTFEKSINLKWRDGVEITKLNDTLTLNIADITRQIVQAGGSVDQIKLAFTSSPRPEMGENENEYILITNPLYDDANKKEVKFTVTLPDNYTIAEDTDDPLAIACGDGSAPYSQLTQTVSDNRNKIVCTLSPHAYDSMLYLKWRNYEEDVKKTNANIEFESENTVFRNHLQTPANADSVTISDGLVFYTEPREGCLQQEKIEIVGPGIDCSLDNVLNLQYGENISYNSQWIKLYNKNNPENVIFIRATRQGEMIKYEIAGESRINQYLEQQLNNEQYTYELKSETPQYTAGITNDLKIVSIRSLKTLKVTFTSTSGIEYLENNDNPIDVSQPKSVYYGETIAFKVKAENIGYDISNIEVLSSTLTKTNTIPLTNGVYVVANITENTTISANNIQKSKIDLSFTQYDGVSYLDTSGTAYNIRQYVPYEETITFQINVEPGYSTDNMVVSAKINDQNIEFQPLDQNNHDMSVPYIDNNLYVIPEEYVKGNIKISINDENGLKRITQKITLKTPDTQDFSNAISYRNQYDTEDIGSENTVNYGESFKFQIRSHEGFDTSQIEVVAKSTSGNAVTIIPANGVYTIENVTDDYTVTVSGIKHTNHTVEFRTSTGVSYLDEFGNTLPSSVTVADGKTVSFYLSFDDAYSKSKSSAKVIIKGSNNTVPHDDSGKYTLGGTTGITENQIIEVTNVTKNSYTATFVPAEGVIYQTAKGKEFNGTLNLEYGESLYFKVALMDAYDQSTPSVKLNGNKSLIENSGSYVIENVNDDVTITVENVEKNPEEIAIENIANVPDSVANENDVDAVVKATRAYDSLSDDEKKLVTNKQDLEQAQNEAGDINHTSGDVTISGLDWYIKLVVTPLSGDKEQMDAFSERIEKRSLLSLYKVELVNLLTEEEYSIPYGNEVQITLPSPDLTGYKNITVAHENLVGNIEYIDPNIVDGVAKFSATTTGLFGIAAKAIPNYSENVSNMTISMGNLAKDEEELKTLLGDELSSQLGHLIDLEDETDRGSGNNEDSSSGNSSSDNSQGDGSDSVLNNMAKKTTDLSNKIYNWALDNEFLAVLSILLLGSGLIALILAYSRKKEKDENKTK